jgi:hypothetical protein
MLLITCHRRQQEVVFVAAQSYSGLEVDQDRSRDVSSVIALGSFWSALIAVVLISIANLVEEDVLAIPTLGRKFLQIAILIDPMFLT